VLWAAVAAAALSDNALARVWQAWASCQSQRSAGLTPSVATVLSDFRRDFPVDTFCLEHTGLEPAAWDWTPPRHNKSCGSGQDNKVDTDEVLLLASRIVHVLDAARNLNVIFGSQLSMSAEVLAVCRTGYYRLRQLRSLVRCLSEE